MTVSNSRLNSHEKEIIDIIEKAMPEGINVRGIIGKGISPSTAKKYLSILENEKKLIHHEKVKNSDVYFIRKKDQFTFEESNYVINQTLNEFEDIIIRSIANVSKWGVSEQIVVYQHMVTAITLMKYFKQFAQDITKKDNIEIPQDIVNYVTRLDKIMTTVNRKINSNFLPLAMIQLQNTVGESLEYLESIANKKRRKGKKSKHIENIVKEITFNSNLKN